MQNKQEFLNSHKINLMRTLLFSAFIILSPGVFSQMQTVQPFLDLGLKVLVGPSMYSSNVFSDNTDVYEHKFNSFGFGGGAKIALDLTDNFAIATEGLFMMNQQVYKLVEPASGEKVIKSSAIEIPVMLRYNDGSGGYTEGGYTYSKVLSVTETVNESIQDAMDLYTSARHGLIFGFGGYLFGSEDIAVSGGFRVRYDLTDIVSTPFSDRNDPSYYALDNAVTKKTSPLSFMFNIELNYDLGFVMARNPCTGRRKMLFTN